MACRAALFLKECSTSMAAIEPFNKRTAPSTVLVYVLVLARLNSGSVIKLCHMGA